MGTGGVGASHHSLDVKNDTVRPKWVGEFCLTDRQCHIRRDLGVGTAMPLQRYLYPCVAQVIALQSRKERVLAI